MVKERDLPLLTKEQLAIKLNVSADTIDGWLVRRKISSIKIGRRLLFDPETERPERKTYTRTGKYARISPTSQTAQL